MKNRIVGVGGYGHGVRKDLETGKTISFTIKTKMFTKSYYSKQIFTDGTMEIYVNCSYRGIRKYFGTKQKIFKL